MNDRESGAVAAKLARVLQPEERVLWTGRRQRRREPGLILVVLVVLWLGALVMSFAARTPGVIVVFGVLTALVVVVGNIVARDVAYGLTDQRAVIVYGRFRPRVRSMPLQWLTEFQLTERPDGVGTIALDPKRRWTPPRGATPAFEDIVDARRVHELIQRAQNKLLNI